MRCGRYLEGFNVSHTYIPGRVGCRNIHELQMAGKYRPQCPDFLATILLRLKLSLKIRHQLKNVLD